MSTSSSIHGAPERAGAMALFARIATTAILGLAAAGTAHATPGSGASGNVLVTGTTDEKVRTRGNEPYDVVVQEITILPQGHTGWHTHPGIAVAVVKSGALTIYDADDASCTAQIYRAGMAYVDPGYGHVHIGRNESTTEPTEVLVTYLDVPVGTATPVLRLDAADPGNCSFPAP